MRGRRDDRQTYHPWVRLGQRSRCEGNKSLKASRRNETGGRSLSLSSALTTSVENQGYSPLFKFSSSASRTCVSEIYEVRNEGEKEGRSAFAETPTLRHRVTSLLPLERAADCWPEEQDGDE